MLPPKRGERENAGARRPPEPVPGPTRLTGPLDRCVPPGGRLHYPPNIPPSLPGDTLPMSDHLDRRLFLGSGAAALGYFFTADALSATRAAETPSETIRFAGI